MDEAALESKLAGAVSVGLERGGEPHAEVYARRIRRGLARFANNVIGQHGALVDVEVTARVMRDGRVAIASAAEPTPEAIARAVKSAAELATVVPPLEGFPGFAPRVPIDVVAPEPSRSTIEATPETRAALLAPHLVRAAESGLLLSGTLETTTYEAAVATTAGQRASSHGAYASARFFAIESRDVSGFAGAMSSDLDLLDVRGLVEHAFERCRMAREPSALEPGAYDVVLEPPAVAEIVEWLNFIGTSARDVEQGSSYLCGRKGERITGERFTLIDDPVAATLEGYGLPFDREGVPSKPVHIIDRGLAGGPVYDRLYAAREGIESTGHASFYDGEIVPNCHALRVLGGDAPRESLVPGLERGLLVSRFHYVNGMLEPRRAVMTGMTRDGTYWVENGRVVRAVKNLRFTDSMLEAFARADAVSVETERVPTWWTENGAIVAPAMRIRGLRFTGLAAEP